MNSNILFVLFFLLVSRPIQAGQLEDGGFALREGRYSDAYELLLPEAEKGNSFAQYNVGWMLRHGLGVEQDYERALAWYELAAEQGDSDAATNLGLMHKEGLGTDRDFVAARNLYRKAALAGNGMAQNNLAALYLEGLGVTVNYPEAIKWLLLAAEQDIPPALNSLGVLYVEGRTDGGGVQKNTDLGTKFLMRAAALGDRQAVVNIFGYTKSQAEDGALEAMHNLGVYYLKGYGTDADSSKGLEWLTRAANAGQNQSQKVLVQLYESGAYGVAADGEKATYWNGIAGK